MRNRTGCQPCRDRHIKCVKEPEVDSCQKCIANRRDCVQENASHRFKPVKSVSLKNTGNGQSARQDLTHDATQIWVSVPSVNFAEQDHYNAADMESSLVPSERPALSGRKKSVIEPAQPTSPHSHPLALNDHWSPDTDHTSVVLPPLVSSPTQPAAASHQQFTSPASLPSYHSPSKRTPTYFSASAVSPNNVYTSPSHHSLRSQQYSVHSVHSPSTSLSTSWPFQTSRQGNLFFHYIKNISPWIDVLDSRCWFAQEIPRRAAHHPVICNAIFALASRHMSLLSGSEDHESPHYVHECLNMVINILEDPLGHSDENLLAAVILLRSHEEMAELDERCHYLGTARILNSIASYAADGGFKECASWICLRQDIYISLTAQQPLSLNLDNYRHSSVFTGQSDEAWANRIIFIFATILNYVLGAPEGHHDPSLWSELEAEAEAWKLTKPWYFAAFWTKRSPDTNRSWPELQTAHPAHAVGLQYYCLCKIVLAIYDPRLLKLGFASHKLRKASEAIVVENLRMAIGLAVSNPDVTNAMFQGSHILSVCGSYLHDPKDQEATVEFLKGMQKSMGWRTTQIIQDLHEQWNG